MSAVLNTTSSNGSDVQSNYSLLSALFLGGGGLEVGGKVLLRVIGTHAQYSARLMSVIPSESIIFVLEGDDLSKFSLGSDVFCSYVSDAEFVMFKSKVLRVGEGPFFCLQLSYPQKIERGVSKRDVRFNVDLAALLRMPKPVESVEYMVSGKILNLGCRGALATSFEPVCMIDDDIEVSMVLPCFEHKVNVRVKAKVKYVQHVDVDAAGQSQFFYGLQFVDVGLRDSLCIKSFLFDCK